MRIIISLSTYFIIAFFTSCLYAKPSRIIKITFAVEQTGDLREELKRYEWQLHGKIFDASIKEVDINLAEQAIDTVFYRKKGQHCFQEGPLLRFQEGFTYVIGYAPCSGSIIYYPAIGKAKQLQVAFQITNYPGKDKIIGQAGIFGNEVALKNNQLSNYYKAESFSICNTEPQSLSIANKSKEKVLTDPIYNHTIVDTPTFTTVLFQSMHDEKIIVAYDYQSGQTKVEIVEQK